MFVYRSVDITPNGHHLYHHLYYFVTDDNDLYVSFLNDFETATESMMPMRIFNNGVLKGEYILIEKLEKVPLHKTLSFWLVVSLAVAIAYTVKEVIVP